MNYLLVKHLHMACVALSGSFFVLRGMWMLAGSSALQQRWVKTLPHVIDSVLLGSAIVLAVWSSQYPGAQPWLTAKLVGLLVYILLGTVALKRGKTKTVRVLAFAGALLSFAYIVGVALTRQPAFFL